MPAYLEKKIVIPVAIVIVLAAAVLLLRAPRHLLLATSLSNVPGKAYTERCLSPESKFKPVWECYEFTLEKPVSDHILIRHTDGEVHKTLAFEAEGQTKFRFTPSKPGVWRFSTGGSIAISAERPEYAKGFVVADGSSWSRSATNEAFVPQFVMYDRPDLDNGLQEFVVEHGFTGFHIRNLRDFLQNPGFFEAIVLKTYRLGGVTHFWIWGDKSRGQTPSTYGIDAPTLYREIAARLGPLPGWTVGYGFDLFEWASAEEIENFREDLHRLVSYRHLVGGRGYKNRYRQISADLDYASWEWHQPSLEDYRDHLKFANGKPAFSEDRFRVRQPTRYPKKDYDFGKTRRGLWHSTFAGGVANIWGYKPLGESYSEPYPNKEAIRTYRTTVDRYFDSGMDRQNDLIDRAACLVSTSHTMCYIEDAEKIRFISGAFVDGYEMSAIDTKKTYREYKVRRLVKTVALPETSDWVIVLHKKGR